MRALKLICERTVGVMKAAWRWPELVALALRQRRLRSALDVLEAERLDRIRNPSKYLGKM
jgi:hypothetical protein